MFTYALKNIKILENFDNNALEDLRHYLDYKVYQPNEMIIHEGDTDHSLFFILEGQCNISRASLNLGILDSGCYFGEGGLISNRARAATIIAKIETKVAILTEENYQKMIKEHPSLAILLTHSIIKIIGWQLIEMTDGMEILMKQRSIPRNVYLDIEIDNKNIRVKTGTKISEIIKDKYASDGGFVIAATLNNKTVSLNTQLFSNSKISPLSVLNFEGERIYRRSATLLFLEAAKKLYPNINFKLGASIGASQWIEIENTETTCEELNNCITKEMKKMIEKKIPFRHEIWAIEEALHYFEEKGLTEVTKLLEIQSNPTVTLVSCGSFYVLSMGTLAPDTSYITKFQISSVGSSLVLHVGEEKTSGFNGKSISAYARVIGNWENWLSSLEIKSVGSFNKACINGNISQIIKVAEGFHEKNISQIADKILHDNRKPKVICIAGPSSSGKTTFIKRLTVQLQVNGLLPYAISLDDYYVDRELTVKDEEGNYDFEALEALDLPLLGSHLKSILEGKKVKTAKYHFPSGKNYNDGGSIIELPENGVLLLEGIHGLNPKLLGDFVDKKRIFKIFIQPMYSLPFDSLSRINPSDLRLLRRIIRDRHTRNLKPEDNIMRWSSVKRGEKKHIFPYINEADSIFDTSLVYELAVLKVYGERYLLEVPASHPAYATAFRLRKLIENFIAIYPDHVPQTSILREFIGGSSFEY
ncbi:MAG: cyclic nucleotide-binding domain-containing protein [Candidatus Sericytochromatia bacterium]